MTAKLSVSVPDDDAIFIDALARRYGGNRSAAIHELVRLGREMNAVDDYAAAYVEWEGSGEATLWGGVASDGIGK